MTIDQRNSRHDSDRVEDLLAMVREVAVIRRFERTAGDEVQGIVDGAAEVVDLTVRLVADGHWSVGIGVGAVEDPLPASTRAGRGPAFEYARLAVDAAKAQRLAVGVRGPSEAATRAETALLLLLDLRESRSTAGAQAVSAMRSGMTQSEAAMALGVTPQAISQRLRVARWDLEQPARELAIGLLAQADVRER